MLATKPSKKQLPKQHEKNTEKGRPRVICALTLGSLKLTENIPCQGSPGYENTPSQLALWRIWFLYDFICFSYDFILFLYDFIWFLYDSYSFYMILYGFYMILYGLYMILYCFYMILYGFYMIFGGVTSIFG